MMQIVNTFKCNFKCEHCMFECTPSKKEMLSMGHFYEFVDKYAEDESYVNLCGGELFLHPDWYQQLKHLLLVCENVRIVTNGSLFFTRSGRQTKLYKQFLELCESFGFGKLVICISFDIYHRAEYDRLNLYPLKEVIRRVRWETEDYGVTFENDRREDRLKQIAPFGRAKKNQLWDYDPECNMGESFEATVGPTGDMFACCNLKIKLGNVFDTPEDIEAKYSLVRPPKSCLHCRTMFNKPLKDEILQPVSNPA